MPSLIQAAIASAVAPVNGSGDRYRCWRPTTYARVANALILQSPTKSSPGRRSPASIRLMSGMYKPSSARSPESTSVANGIPNGSNEPIITLIWGRRRIIFTVAKLQQAPVTHLMSTRNGGGITTDHILRQGIDFHTARIQLLFDLVPIGRLAQVFEQMAQPVITEIQGLMTCPLRWLRVCCMPGCTLPPTPSGDRLR